MNKSTELQAPKNTSLTAFEKADLILERAHILALESKILARDIESAPAEYVPTHVRTVIHVNLAIGVLCIGSAILKSWLSTPNSLDGAILLAGLVLCGVSLFREFKLGKNGLSAKLREFSALTDRINSLRSNSAENGEKVIQGNATPSAQQDQSADAEKSRAADG